MERWGVGCGVWGDGEMGRWGDGEMGSRESGVGSRESGVGKHPV
ncbi:hypothetical protein [Moorena sp. SIOASIH]|nr:hypothetical protein [Moorena sp. SIOASIH]